MPTPLSNACRAVAGQVMDLMELAYRQLGENDDDADASHPLPPAAIERLAQPH